MPEWRRAQGAGRGVLGAGDRVPAEAACRDAGAHAYPPHSMKAQEAEEKPETLKSYRVVCAAGHIAYNHVRDRQNLPVFRLLDEDGHPSGHQLAVILYPLRPGDELPV